MRESGQEMGSKEVIYGKLYYHFNNFCPLYWEIQFEY